MTTTNIRSELDGYIELLQNMRQKLQDHAHGKGDNPKALGDEANVRMVAIDGLLTQLSNVKAEEVDLTKINKISTDVTDVVTSVARYFSRQQVAQTTG